MQSSSLVIATASESIPESTGTRWIDPCAVSMLITNADVAHLACRTKYVLRPGRTNACVTMRVSPFSTTRLHALHLARELGATPIE